MSNTLNAGYQDRHGADWGFYQVITKTGRKSGYAVVSLVDDMGLVYVAQHLGLATLAQVEEVNGPLSAYHN